MCDVPSIAVFVSESIECFPGTVSKFFLKLLVTLPVAPIITGIIIHFRFHIRCILTFFPLPFAQQFCLQVLPHLSMCMFSLFCFMFINNNIIIVTAIESWNAESVYGNAPTVVYCRIRL